MLLVPIAFATSCLAGAVGMGGGVLLIALMPGLVPAGAIIPLHAATQLASNASRALFGWRSIDRGMMAPLMLGAALGAATGGALYRQLQLDWLPALIGLCILCLTWAPLPQVGGSGRGGLFALGFYQTAAGMIAGATGPLGAALLLRRNRDKNWLVVNTAVYMSLNHLLRMLAFIGMGFGFARWAPLLAGMIPAVIAGSWVGTRLRGYIPQLDFERWFRWLVTLLALRMMAFSPLIEDWLGSRSTAF